jgi:hypothetical protein
MFQSEPACRNTSIGPIAVEENIWSSSRTVISFIFVSARKSFWVMA